MSDRVSELTTDELRALVEDAVRGVLRQMLSEGQDLPKLKSRPPLDIPILDVGPWPEGLELISREEMYGDDGR